MKEKFLPCILGFVLGVIACLCMGAELYHPNKGVLVNAVPGSALEQVMQNQEAIFNLIDAKCGTK